MVSNRLEKSLAIGAIVLTGILVIVGAFITYYIATMFNEWLAFALVSVASLCFAPTFVTRFAMGGLAVAACGIGIMTSNPVMFAVAGGATGLLLMFPTLSTWGSFSKSSIPGDGKLRDADDTNEFSIR